MTTCEDENKKLKKRNAELVKQNAYLKKASNKKELVILLLYSAAVTVVSIPVTIGIDVCAKLFFKEEEALKAKIATYTIIALIIFPLIGCVVSNCYGNVQKAKNNQLPESKNEKEEIAQGNFIKQWWEDFTSPENCKKNLLYYPIIALTNTFLLVVQFIAFKGIEEIFKGVNDHSIEIKIGATALVAVCLVIISTVFSYALKELLWGEKHINSATAEEVVGNTAEK